MKQGSSYLIVTDAACARATAATLLDRGNARKIENEFVFVLLISLPDWLVRAHFAKPGRKVASLPV